MHKALQAQVHLAREGEREVWGWMTSAFFSLTCTTHLQDKVCAEKALNG
jgi:hypothetical protein